MINFETVWVVNLTRSFKFSSNSTLSQSFSLVRKCLKAWLPLLLLLFDILLELVLPSKEISLIILLSKRSKIRRKSSSSCVQYLSIMHNLLSSVILRLCNAFIFSLSSLSNFWRCISLSLKFLFCILRTFASKSSYIKKLYNLYYIKNINKKIQLKQ